MNELLLLIELVSVYCVIFFFIIFYTKGITDKNKKIFPILFFTAQLLSLICLLAQKKYEVGMGMFAFVIATIFNSCYLIAFIISKFKYKPLPNYQDIYLKKENYNLTTKVEITISADDLPTHYAIWTHQDETGLTKHDIIKFLGNYPQTETDIVANMFYDEKSQIYLCRSYRQITQDSTPNDKKELKHTILLYAATLIYPVLIAYAELTNNIPLKDKSFLYNLCASLMMIILFGSVRKLTRNPSKDSYTRFFWLLARVFYYLAIITSIISLVISE